MLVNHHLKPIFSVMLDGQDISSRLLPRLMSLSITETRADEADQLDITLSDADGLLAIPTRDVKIKVSIGFEHTGLVEKGEFNIDEVEYRGAPDTITIKGRSAKLDGPLRTRTERSFHKKTVADIVKTIAKANNLEPVIDRYAGTKKIDHIDQTNESDITFLNRLGKRFDVVVTVKEGKLLFIPTHGGKKADGTKMPTLSLDKIDGDNYSFRQVSRDSYTGVTAFWMEPRKSKRSKVVYGTIGNAKQLRETFSNEKDALEAAKAEYQRLKRGRSSMRFDMAVGNPVLSPQYIVQFPSMKQPINDIEWLVKSVTHKLDESGLTTSLELELVGDEEGSA